MIEICLFDIILKPVWLLLIQQLFFKFFIYSKVFK